MAQAKRDENRIPTLLAVSSVDGETPVTLYADPTTHRLYVDLPTASGDVVGPASSTDNAIVLFDGLTGKIIKDSTVLLSSLPTGSGTINEITYWSGANTLSSLAVATYPSLTELAYVKGVTSGIQGQINAKGSGTVTDVSVTTANGVSGSVATSTTTPAITLTLGAITPTSVSATSFVAVTPSSDTIAGVFRRNNSGQTANIIEVQTEVNGFLAGFDKDGNLTLPKITTTGNLELGNASDTTIARASAGVASIEGNNIVVNTSSPTLATITTTGNIELGNASDTTLSRSGAGQMTIEGVQVLTATNTVTETNKRKQPRVYSAANNASLTPEIDTYDIFHLTAMSAATTINNHSTSTPADGELMEFRFLDNGTARGLTWGTAYVAKAGVALPTTTVLSKNLTCLFEYNSNLAKWNLLASGQEA